MIMGFIIQFYIIFRTNLLTGGPTQICCFMPISVFRGKGILDGVKTERNQLEKLILEGNPPDGLGVHVRGVPGCSRGWGARPLPREHPGGPPTYPLHPYILVYPKTSRTEDRSGVPPLQAFVATKNLSGAHSGTLPEGGPITGGHLHHPGAIHDEEGVVHPRGWGYVPVAMCLISLSCSLSCSSMARSWCIPSFAIVVGSYDVSPPLLPCDGLSFPFEVILSDWVFFEHLMYVLPWLSMVTMGYHVPLDVCFGDQLVGFVTLGTYG